MSVSRSNSSAPWLFGAVPDLLLGGGGCYFVLFLGMSALGDSFRDAIPMSILPLVVLLTGVPHYGATVVRICKRQEDRRAYARVAIGSSLLMIAMLALGLRSEILGSLLLTVYLTWSPWHYSGQNYGIALMFLRRRGIDVNPAKRWIYAFFALSFAVVVVSLHTEVPGTGYAPIEYEGTIYQMLPIGLPIGVQLPLTAVLAFAGFGCLVVAGTLLVRAGARARDLLPPLVVAGSQALWFAIPGVARAADWFQAGGPLALDYAVYAFLWVGVAHSVQYLWITSYYAGSARRSEGATADAAYFGRYGALVLATGAALWVVPALVFAPGALGDVPFHAGLGALIASVVNIHHFILDGVIWKLRDGRIAGLLLRPSVPRPHGFEPVRAAPFTRGRAFARGVAWAAGLACVGVYAVAEVEYELGARPALERGDLARARTAVERLEALGRDGAQIRILTGLLEAEEGDLETGIADLERAVALQSTSEANAGLARLYDRAGRYDDAIAAYRTARENDPDSPELANNLAWLLALRRSDDESVAEAITLARAASKALGGQSATALDTLAVAHAAAGDFARARVVGKRALEVARREGDAEQASELAARLNRYRRGELQRPDD